MAKQIELLFARRLRRVQRGMFCRQRLQLPVMFVILVELPACPRERIEQLQLLVSRQQRLMIVRPVKVDQFVAKIFQDRQGGRRAIDELAVCAACRKRALDDEITFTRFNACFDQLRI